MLPEGKCAAAWMLLYFCNSVMLQRRQSGEECTFSSHRPSEEITRELKVTEKMVMLKSFFSKIMKVTRTSKPRGSFHLIKC